MSTDPDNPTAPPDPLAQVVSRLRRRAGRARWSAFVFLIGLIATVAAGLAFYLLLPFWENYVDARQATLDRTLVEIDAEDAALDETRARLISRDATAVGGEGLALLLRHQVERMESGSESYLAGAVELEGALLLYGSSGTILRSTDGGETYERIETESEALLMRHVALDAALLLYGSDGAVLRSTDGGETFAIIDTGPATRRLFGHAELDGELLLYGLQGVILRSADDGESFAAVDLDSGEDFFRHVAVEGGLLLYGRDGTILRYAGGGEAFIAVEPDIGNGFFGHAEVEGGLLFYGRGGRILRSTDGGETFEDMPTSWQETVPWEPWGGLWGHARLEDGLLLYGSFGTVLRYRDGDGSLTALATGAEGDLEGHAELAGALLVYGDDGAIVRSTDDGRSFDVVESGAQGWLSGHAESDAALFLYGNLGTILRSTDDGETFIDLPWDDDFRLEGHIAAETGLLFYGEDGTLLRLTQRWSRAVAGLMLEAGEPGDRALAAFLDSLPQRIREWPPVAAIRAELSALQNRRAALDILRQNTDQRLEEIKRFPYAQWRRDRVLLEMESFMGVCRGAEAGSVELTAACLEAWRAQRDDGESWWRTLAEQVPPGILILFLLATLGALYRYNLRLAGFHDSRADALELLARGRSAEGLRDVLATSPGEAVDFATVFLAADKVEMGAIKARLGQAEVEIAKALRSDR